MVEITETHTHPIRGEKDWGYSLQLLGRGPFKLWVSITQQPEKHILKPAPHPLQKDQA